MKVRTALHLINNVLNTVLREQDDDFDEDTKFAVLWFRENGFDPGPFGNADSYAKSLNAPLDPLERSGILTKARNPSSGVRDSTSLSVSSARA